VIFILSSCKKQTASISINGKWYIKSYLSAYYVNGVADTVEDFTLTVPDTTIYYEFDSGGKGSELESPFIKVIFDYKTSGSNLILQTPLDRIPAKAAITMPTPNDLILKGSYQPQANNSNLTIASELHLVQH
jgi:hypothetical protein